MSDLRLVTLLIISTTTIVLTQSFLIHYQVSRGKYGLSVDADVGLWLEKRQLDGEPDLDTVGNGSFVVIDSSLHNDFDDFKDKFPQYTRRGFSMIPQNELIHY